MSSIVPTNSDSLDAPDVTIDSVAAEEMRNRERNEQSKWFKLYVIQDRRAVRHNKKLKKEKELELEDLEQNRRSSDVVPRCSYFNLLPSEIFTIIFSLCPPYDMLRMRRVCKLWKEMADNDSLWIYYFRTYVDPNNKYQREATIIKPWKHIYLEHILNEPKTVDREESKRIEKTRQRDLKKSFRFNLAFVSIIVLIILTAMIIDSRWRTSSVVVVIGICIFLVGSSSEYPSQKKAYFPQFPVLWMIGWIIVGIFSILLGLTIRNSMSYTTCILLARASIAFWFILFLFDRWRSRFRVRFTKFGGFMGLLRLFGSLAAFSFHTRDLETIFSTGEINPISSFDIPIYIFAVEDFLMSSLGFIQSARRHPGLPIFTVKRFNKYSYFSFAIALYALFVLLLVLAFQKRVPLFLAAIPILVVEIFYLLYRIIELHKYMNGNWLGHLKHTLLDRFQVTV